jgi:hypothetical protein
MHAGALFEVELQAASTGITCQGIDYGHRHQMPECRIQSLQALGRVIVQRGYSWREMMCFRAGCKGLSLRKSLLTCGLRGVTSCYDSAATRQATKVCRALAKVATLSLRVRALHSDKKT